MPLNPDEKETLHGDDIKGILHSKPPRIEMPEAFFRRKGMQLKKLFSKNEITSFETNSVIGDEGAKILARALKGNQTLKILDLTGAGIGAEGAVALAAALSGSEVEELDLTLNSIGDKGAEALAAALPGSKVKSLWCTACQIGNKGAAAVAAALPTSKVKELGLQGNEVCADGVEALAGALQGSQLKTLDLAGTFLGKQGFDALIGALEQNPALTTLTLRHCKITDWEERKISEAASQVFVAMLDKNWTLTTLEAPWSKGKGENIEMALIRNRRAAEEAKHAAQRLAIEGAVRYPEVALVPALVKPKPRPLAPGDFKSLVSPRAGAITPEGIKDARGNGKPGEPSRRVISFI